MSENEKKNEGQSCCCCQCWKVIFIAIALLTIGAVIGHKMTMRHHCGQMAMNHPCCYMMPMRHPCCPMMRGPCGGDYGREVWRDRVERKREGRFEHKFREGKEQKGWFGHKADRGKHQPGCTCPICSKKAASLSEPNKAHCPMIDKKEGKSEKD